MACGETEMSQTAQDRYVFGDLPLDPIEAGTNILVTGPSLGGTRELCLQLLASDADGLLLVAADESGTDAIESFEHAGGLYDPSRMGVIDCSQHGEADADSNVCVVNSPGDLTGIGIQYSRLYEHLHGSGVDAVRTGLYSLSTILPYVDEIQPVYRFLHTITGRIRAADGLGICALDPDTQDERIVGSIAQPFDGRLELRRDDAGASEIRLQGLPGHDEGWRAYDPTGA